MIHALLHYTRATPWSTRCSVALRYPPWPCATSWHLTAMTMRCSLAPHYPSTTRGGTRGTRGIHNTRGMHGIRSMHSIHGTSARLEVHLLICPQVDTMGMQVRAAARSKQWVRAAQLLRSQAPY